MEEGSDNLGLLSLPDIPPLDKLLSSALFQEPVDRASSSHESAVQSPETLVISPHFLEPLTVPQPTDDFILAAE